MFQKLWHKNDTISWECILPHVFWWTSYKTEHKICPFVKFFSLKSSWYSASISPSGKVVPTFLPNTSSRIRFHTSSGRQHLFSLSLILWQTWMKHIRCLDDGIFEKMHLLLVSPHHGQRHEVPPGLCSDRAQARSHAWKPGVANQYMRMRNSMTLRTRRHVVRRVAIATCACIA